MSSLLPFVLVGLTSGAIYGLAGVGLVLTYKTSGIFNFAFGAVGTVAAYGFYEFNVVHGMPWPVAALISVGLVGVLGGFLFERLAKAISQASLALQVASTVGILLIVEALATIIYGTTQAQQVPEYLPQDIVRVLGTNITTDQIIVFGVSVVATSGLYIFFRFARLGTAMRALVDNSELLDLAGTNPTTARRWAWIIGTTFAAAAGVLLAPYVSLTGFTLTLLVIQAFGAAAIGGFSSLPWTFAGGIGIGIAASISTKYFTNGVLSGVPASMPFIVLFVVLLVFPKSKVGEQPPIVPRVVSNWRAPPLIQLVGGAVILGILVLVPSFAGFHLGAWTEALSYVILLLSMGLLVRTSGQVSLCQIAFVAIGAAAFSHFVVDYHVPWLIALLLCGVVAMPIGALLAIPAIRLTGLYLALATFGFGILVANMFYTSSWMFGSSGLGIVVPRPDLRWINLSSDTNFYYLVLLIVVITAGFVIALTHGRLGRLLHGLADSPTALQTSGTSVNVTRVVVFCISAFLAAIAGALQGMQVVRVTGDLYDPFLSLTLLALVVIVVGREPWYALMGAFGLLLIPSYLTGVNVTNYLEILFGVGAVLYAVVPNRWRELPASKRERIDALFRRSPSAEQTSGRETDWVLGSGVGSATTRSPTASKLEVLNLTVKFGGLVAVDNVSLEVTSGQIVGLIGPNGAGKTTTFNACSGLIRPTSGEIRLNERIVTRQGPSSRARLGLGRTFQRMELFESMSVYENVALGAEAASAGRNPLNHLVSNKRGAAKVQVETIEALELCGLGQLQHTPVAVISTGQRRLVELARCLAGSHSLLLLDEPSSGLDQQETLQFGSILTRVVEVRGVGVLLVEHDMSLVMSVCDNVYVLDFGQLIAEGSPGQIKDSPVVQAAYLGEPDNENDALAATRSTQ